MVAAGIDWCIMWLSKIHMFAWVMVNNLDLGHKIGNYSRSVT
jgi:hypothetical protein